MQKILYGVCFLGALAGAVHAQPTIRVAKSYEDTVRVLILYNSTATGWSWCSPATTPVGPLTKDFTVGAIAGLTNVKVLKAETTQWTDVQSAFPGGKLPHVIVHVNAGWYTYSGPYIGDVLNTAADKAIGVVSIGDDAAQFAEKVFGFTSVNNTPAPMGDATQYKAANTNLWIDLNGKADSLPSPGVIRNTVDSLKVGRLEFKPFGTGAGDFRCQADADKYTVLPTYLDKLNFLGFQRAFDGKDTIAGPKELQTIVAFQEEQRRGVALSFQPQFLKDAKAASQIIYDAVVYASYAHFYYNTVTTPVATPGSSSFLSQISVALSTVTPGAAIYYTLDGKTPDSAGTLYNPAKPILIIGNATLKAIAYKPGWLESGIMTEVYSKTFTPSSLQIFDQSGNPPAGGYLSGLNTAYTLRLTTTQAGLAQVTLPASTLNSKDKESFTLANPATPGSGFIFSETRNFSIAANGTSGNNKTEAAVYDTLTVRWTNPKDPKDTAVAKVPVRPAPKQAIAYFSTKPDGSDTTDQYLGTETRIYLVVLDQVLPAGKVPTVTLETTPRLGSGRGKDTEILNLAVNPAAPGKYIVAIDVDINPAAVPGDKKLQLALEDLIKATYSDPMDAEPPAVANAGFGIAPEISASLLFTDKNGNALPAGLYYSPAEGALYLSYKDDWVNGGIASKTVLLTIENNGGKAPSDVESFAIKLVLSKRKGSTGVWEGSLTLKDPPNPVSGNGIAETYILGKVNAKVNSHDKGGTETGTVFADLLVAYPNQDAQIGLEGPKGPGAQIDRDDASVKITIKDQSFSSGTDTLYATLSCSESKDLLNVMLIEKSGTPGTYESAVIPKSEGASVADAKLQCLSRDYLKVSYRDPVYGDLASIQVLLDNPVTTRLLYSRSPSDSSQIGSVSENEASFFYAIVSAHSPSLDKADSLAVVFTTAQGEKETFWAVETGIYSQKFIVKVPYAFGTVAADNGTLEGIIIPSNLGNQVTASGLVTVEGIETRADIKLVAAYVPVVKAYIQDADFDGAADKVYVVFAKPLPRLPSSLEAQWNTTAGAFKGGAKLSFLGGDSSIVVADYSGSPFGAGLTSIPTGEEPKAKLPSDPLFAGQTPLLQDSIGPVIMEAVKHPADVNTLKAGDPSFNMDTLIITLSEPIKATTDFKQMLKFSTNCADYANARTIKAVNTPEADGPGGDRYIIIVDNSSSTAPQTGNCVFLNADGLYTDLPGNLPPKTGFKLDGGDRDRILQLFRGYPPVAGLDPSLPGYQVAVQDSRDPEKGGYSVNGVASWNVNWIPPVGFNEDAAKYGSADHGPIPANVKDAATGETDLTRDVPLPAFLSTVQVVTTAAYVAEVSLFDNLGNFVVSFRQAFGYRGELGNVQRVVPRGLASFLWWDMRDRHGQLAGQGVYVWKVVFRFQNGKQEIRYIRTGLMRSGKN